MKNMTLDRIAKSCKGELHGKYAEEIQDVVIDSRKVRPGCLFVAMKGKRVDGHTYIKAVEEAGAAAVICERVPEDCRIPYILVHDSFQALKDIAIYYRGTLAVKVVGITGSVGKTSTKEFVASVLEQRYKVLKTAGNYNSEIGLPLMILSICPEHEVAVLEMGISEFGEMHRLSEIARPDAAVITNIGVCHLENLKSRDGILKAKTEIFDYLNPDGSVFLNGDDDKLIGIQQVNGKKPVLFGHGEGNSVTVRNCKSKGLFGSDCEIVTPDGDFSVNVPLPGEHMVQNALAATAVGLSFGLTIEEIKEGIEQVKTLRGRCNIITLPDMTLIDDCYNANPISMKMALDLLTTADTKKVAILGDMYELGENELSFHQEVGTYAVKSGVDVLICIGEKSLAMFEAAKKASTESKIQEIRYYETVSQFCMEASKWIQKEDTVLLKASNKMHFDTIIQILKGEQNA